MSSQVQVPVPNGSVRSYRKIPRAGFLEMLPIIAGGRRERIDMLGNLRRLHDRHGKVVMQNVGLLKFVNLYGPDANRFVLLDRARVFSAKRPWHTIMGRVFPNGLLLRDGENHKLHRRIMHQAFTRPALREYTERMGPMIERGIAAWPANGQPFPAFPAFKEMTLDLAASLFVGVELGPQTRLMNRAFEDMVTASMSRLRLPIPGLEFHRGLKGRAFMIRYFADLFDARSAEEGSDMFSRLRRAESEEGDRFSNQEIVDHMIFLMMAAHDTTTSTLSSMTYELARNPEWQERVREESFALGKPHISYEDVEGLEVHTRVMKETLRRYPPLPVIPRVATAEVEFEGYRIPARAMVVVSPIHTHHMPEWWDDPFRFDPDRFSPQRAEDERHSHSWVPFGAGPHMCLGLRFAEIQIKTVMHQLVRRYRWSVPEGYTMPVQQAPISRPMDGLPIQLHAIA